VYQFNHTPGANLGFHSAAAYVTGIILPDVLQSALHIRPAQPDTNSSPLSALNLRHEQRAASLSRLNAQPDRQDPASINIGDYAFIQRRSRRSKLSPSRIGLTKCFPPSDFQKFRSRLNVFDPREVRLAGRSTIFSHGGVLEI